MISGVDQIQERPSCNDGCNGTATGQARVAEAGTIRPGQGETGGCALGAQAGEAAIRRIATDAGFTRFRRPTETPFNIVYEVRPSGPSTGRRGGAPIAVNGQEGTAMRPRQPDRSGFVSRDGVRVAWEVHGDQNSPSVLLLPTWSIADAGHWKFQVPVLARRYRVVVIEGRGNGRSDRPVAPGAYTISEYLADAIAVLDATGTSEAVVAGVSMGAARALALAAQEPSRVLGAVLIGPSVGSSPIHPPAPPTPTAPPPTAPTPTAPR